MMVHLRLEAELWLSTLSLVGTPAWEHGLKPGPVKPQKVVL